MAGLGAGTAHPPPAFELIGAAMLTEATFWLTLGFIGQALFALRFVVQWLASEKAGESVIPPLFWYISVPAGLILVAYAVWRQDPVFIVNEALCVAIFIRNVIMVRREKAGAQ
jgi:lipid-A-disaccharide synthase-like uncharacterized protein